MRNLFKMIFQRVVFVSFAILVQLIFFAVTMLRFEKYSDIFSTVLLLLTIPILLYIISDRTNPSYKIAWIIPIMAFPVFGVTMYIMFGGNRLSRRLKEKLLVSEKILRHCLHQDPALLTQLEQESPDAANQSKYLINAAFSPVYRNTESTYLTPGEVCFPVMLQELRKAEKFIFLEYFIIENGEMWGAILEILKDKAAHGVDVRVIYDDFGCITRLPMRYARTLARYNIRCRSFNPYIPILSSRLNNRDHHKYMIIDGKVGFTGGINRADEYTNRITRFGYWKDSAIMLRGDAVNAMTIMFLSTWATFQPELDIPETNFAQYLAPPLATAGTGYVQPYCDSPLDFEPVGENVYLNLINHAKHSVYIMTPYLIISDTMQSALTTAAKSGVDVRIITPHVPDKRYVHTLTRSYYECLIEAGVKIYEYTPGFIHSKVFCVDDEYATVGSVNLDFRSLYLHFENGVLLYKADAIPAIRADFDETFDQCHLVSLVECRAVPLPTRLFRSLLRMFAPLL